MTTTSSTTTSSTTTSTITPTPTSNLTVTVSPIPTVVTPASVSTPTPPVTIAQPTPYTPVNPNNFPPVSTSANASTNTGTLQSSTSLKVLPSPTNPTNVNIGQIQLSLNLIDLTSKSLDNTQDSSFPLLTNADSTVLSTIVWAPIVNALSIYLSQVTNLDKTIPLSIIVVNKLQTAFRMVMLNSAYTIYETLVQISSNSNLLSSPIYQVMYWRQLPTLDAIELAPFSKYYSMQDNQEIVTIKNNIMQKLVRMDSNTFMGYGTVNVIEGLKKYTADMVIYKLYLSILLGSGNNNA